MNLTSGRRTIDQSLQYLNTTTYFTDSVDCEGWIFFRGKRQREEEEWDCNLAPITK